MKQILILSLIGEEFEFDSKEEKPIPEVENRFIIVSSPEAQDDEKLIERFKHLIEEENEIGILIKYYKEAGIFYMTEVPISFEFNSDMLNLYKHIEEYYENLKR